MNSEQKPKSLHNQHGYDCSILWHVPVQDNGCDNRKIKATCLRKKPQNFGEAYWRIIVELDGKILGHMVLRRDSRTYAVALARGMVMAIKTKASHARRNRLNRKQIKKSI